ncbi:hypothetical protein D3C81_1140200 [compost metagenome]
MRKAILQEAGCDLLQPAVTGHFKRQQQTSGSKQRPDMGKSRLDAPGTVQRIRRKNDIIAVCSIALLQRRAVHIQQLISYRSTEGF